MDIILLTYRESLRQSLLETEKNLFQEKVIEVFALHIRLLIIQTILIPRILFSISHQYPCKRAPVLMT